MNLKAQDSFKVGGMYRNRAEFRNGYRTLAADTSKPAFFVGQRARLTFEYKKDSIFTFYSSLQDVRTWGDEEQTKDLSGLHFNEIFMEMRIKKNFYVKLGRQEFAYDDHRLLGNLDWANASRSHDGLIIKYLNSEKKFNWHLGSSFNQVGEPIFGTSFTLNNYKFLGFTWIKKNFKIHDLSLLAIMNGLNSKDTTSKSMKSTVTTGLTYHLNHENFKATLGGFYQMGKTDYNLDVASFMINSYFGYAKNKFLTGLGFDYLSGNKDNTDSKQSKNFNTLYPTNHKFYGYMDYFLGFPTDVKSRGLNDIYLRVGYAISPKILTTLDGHYFMLANENNLTTNKVKKALGSELDFILEYKPSNTINLQIGYSMIFATENMEYIKGGNKNKYNGWAFVMLKVAPVFFNHTSEKSNNQ